MLKSPGYWYDLIREYKFYNELFKHWDNSSDNKCLTSISKWYTSQFKNSFEIPNQTTETAILNVNQIIKEDCNSVNENLPFSMQGCFFGLTLKYTELHKALRAYENDDKRQSGGFFDLLNNVKTYYKKKCLSKLNGSPNCKAYLENNSYFLKAGDTTTENDENEKNGMIFNIGNSMNTLNNPNSGFKLFQSSFKRLFDGLFWLGENDCQVGENFPDNKLI